MESSTSSQYIIDDEDINVQCTVYPASSAFTQIYFFLNEIKKNNGIPENGLANLSIFTEHPKLKLFTELLTFFKLIQHKIRFVTSPDTSTLDCGDLIHLPVTLSKTTDYSFASYNVSEAGKWECGFSESYGGNTAVTAAEVYKLSECFSHLFTGLQVSHQSPS